MKEYSDNPLKKFDNLGLRNVKKDLNSDNNIEKSNNKLMPSDRETEKPEITIKDFEVYTTLGTGTFGRVRQAKLKNDKSNTIFALKMLKKTEIVRLNQVEHIKSEKFILENINHPFIVDLKCSFQDSKYIYMLFEFISGMIFSFKNMSFAFQKLFKFSTL